MAEVSPTKNTVRTDTFLSECWQHASAAAHGVDAPLYLACYGTGECADLHRRLHALGVVLVPLEGTRMDIERRLRRSDGVIIASGAANTDRTDAVMSAALRHRVPVLAIGAALYRLNAYFGGTSRALPSQCCNTLHQVRVQGSSWLRGARYVFGVLETERIGRMGDGLRPTVVHPRGQVHMVEHEYLPMAGVASADDTTLLRDCMLYMQMQRG